MIPGVKHWHRGKEEGEGHSMWMDRKQKKKEEEAGTNSAMSGARNLEAESIRSRIDSTSP